MNISSAALYAHILHLIICPVAWKSWENYVRQKAIDKGDIYVITGTIPGTETYAHYA